jgi:hypothetical protein
MESVTVYGGEQSAPLYYDNTTAGYSEATVNVANLQVGQDWTKHGIQTLTLWFHGTVGNTGQMYVKINGSKLDYPGNVAEIRWMQWNIDLADLASLGVNLQDVTTLAIGIEGDDTSGTLYFDDFRLYRLAPSLSEALDTTLSVTTDGSANWFSQTAISYYDGDAAQSGDISDDEESFMQTTVSGAGTVSFYWKASTEGGYDFLEFSIDGELQNQISGEVDWEQMTYTITASGSHTLEWRYVRDYADGGGDDCGWVDNLEWDGGG